MSDIQSILHETRVFSPSDEFVKQANVSGMASYKALCKAARDNGRGNCTIGARVLASSLGRKLP